MFKLADAIANWKLGRNAPSRKPQKEILDLTPHKLQLAIKLKTKWQSVAAIKYENQSESRACDICWEEIEVGEFYYKVDTNSRQYDICTSPEHAREVRRL